jgi:calcineurin-like phosphoesterase family protein
MYYFTADWHLGHENVLKFCKRPFADLQDMEHTLIQNVNRTLKITDTLWMLGDTFWVMPNNERREILGRLNCRVVLVRGNHDGKIRAMSTNATILDYAIVQLGNTEVSVSHYPLRPSLIRQIGHHLGYRPIRHIAKFPPRMCDLWHLHGHVHSPITHSPAFPGQIHVGVDAWDYKPVSADKILDIIRKEGVK